MTYKITINTQKIPQNFTNSQNKHKTSTMMHKTSTMTQKTTTNLHKFMKKPSQIHSKPPQIYSNLHKFPKNAQIRTKPAQRDVILPLLFFLILQVMDGWQDDSPRRTRRAKQWRGAATGAWRESVSIFHLYFTRGIKHGWYISRVLMVTFHFSRTRAARSWKRGQRNRMLRTSWTTVS